CQVAAENGHLSCLPYAHEKCIRWDLSTTDGRGKNGHLDCLQHAHDNGFTLTTRKCGCAAAAKNGHLNCLRYLHEHDCGRDLSTCSEAAAGGHLDCMLSCPRKHLPSERENMRNGRGWSLEMLAGRSRKQLSLE
ncbi:unnamed protein product, partial [Phaeothamnion confervicola]